MPPRGPRTAAPELLGGFHQRSLYTYASSPKALNTNRKMMASPKPEIPGHVPHVHLMYDRRIIRGSNYTARPCARGDGESQAAKAAALRRKEVLKRSKGRIMGQLGGPYPLGEPPFKSNVRHESIQTNDYLEELFERPPEFDVSCQTDLFLCRPPTPPYVPVKTGIDVYTEILPGELWDFDTEVQPILECLVGKTLEQALLEVLEDEELQSLREQQERLLEARETERAEARRLEEEERRLQDEKDRRIAQQKHADQLDKETCERVTAAMLLQGHIEKLLPRLLQETVPCGDGLKGLGGQETAKWLSKEVANEISKVVDSREILEEMVHEIVVSRADAYRNLYEPYNEEFDHLEEGEVEIEDEAEVEEH